MNDIIKNKIAKNKSTGIKNIIIESLDIINSVGVPIDDLTVRRLEKMAMSFMAVCSMSENKTWNQTKSVEDSHILRTREIITYINEHFEENISSGSYDDIRRKDLIRLVGMGLVIKSANNPQADTNDGTRGYAIGSFFSKLVKSYNSGSWKNELSSFKIDEDYIRQFNSKRELKKLNVTLPDGLKIELDEGKHNLIQKAVIESFLPLYGHNAEVLYIGDTSEKQMHKYSDKMIGLGLNIEDRGMLPDIIAFSEEKEWLYLIEAVHSSNPLNPERCIELKRTVLANCKFGVVFVTAFLSRKEFSKWLPQIAWETEVWLADRPEHMIHFNGDKFLGPHEL